MTGALTLRSEERIVEQLQRSSLSVRDIAIGNGCSVEAVEHVARSYMIQLPAARPPTPPATTQPPLPVSTPDVPDPVDPTPPPTVEGGLHRRYRRGRAHLLTGPGCPDEECPTFCSGCGCCEHCTDHACRCLDRACLCSIEDGLTVS